MQILESNKFKVLTSPDYNYVFNKENGFFVRFGKTIEEDPDFSSYGCELLDLEISAGRCSSGCFFCYKENGPNEPEINMTFAQFKEIFDKLPRTICQIALGICDCHSNPDLFKIIRYARKKGVICNYTTNGLDVTPVVAELTARFCGAVAVSIVNKEKSYDAIKLFSDAMRPNFTLKQINIHYVISTERIKSAMQIVDDVANDPRLKKVNAIVWLQYKQKGKNPDILHSVTNVDIYKKLIEHCENKGVGYGFDSCSQYLFIESIKDRKNSAQLETLSDPCESLLYSLYINCKGIAYPCSFCEGAPGWEEGIPAFECNDFVEDIWNHPKFTNWRERLLKNNRRCPIYNI